MVVAYEPEDVSPREVVGDKEESVVDNTYKHKADAVQEVIYEVIEATRPPSSEETCYDSFHGGSNPCHICGKIYKRAQQCSHAGERRNTGYNLGRLHVLSIVW